MAYQGNRGAMALLRAQKVAPGVSVRKGLRLAGFVGLTGLFLYLLHDRLQHLDAAAVMASLQAVTFGQYLIALALTGISFWALGAYDATMARHLGFASAPAQNRRAGMAAIAISQTLGMGVVTGALIRWRMLPLTLFQATRLSFAVAVSFLMGLAVLTALVLIAEPDASPLRAPAYAVLALGLGFTALCLWQPRLPGWMPALPNLFTLGRILAFTALDCLCAAGVLLALCPPDLALTMVQLLPVFLLALGAGLVSGAPGGVGAFEMMLLAGLPTLPEAPLVAAILAYRAVYFALPAVIGAVVAALTRFERTQEPQPEFAQKTLSEQNLESQGQLRFVAFPGQIGWLTGHTPHSEVALLDPACAPREILHALSLFTDAARASARVPCLYKIGPRCAAIARRSGMTTLPVAAEAWLNPAGFTCATPARAALRRKLRRAEAAGVTVSEAQGLPMPALSAIAAGWSREHGGERGFSMGRFEEGYIRGQRVFVAWQQNRPIAFITLHAAANDWSLDLMRHEARLPDGTMHALVTAAIETAAREGITRLSLAAVPRLPALAARVLRSPQGHGLLQFKSSFAPRWRNLYIAAPNPPLLALAAAEIARAIHRPPPLAGQNAAQTTDATGQKPIASASHTWQTGAKQG